MRENGKKERKNKQKHVRRKTMRKKEGDNFQQTQDSNIKANG